MFITTHNLLPYLLAKGLVSNESVVDGDFAVSAVSGRNRNFKVLQRAGPSYFVKQTQNWDPQGIAMLQAEAACYWLAHNDSDFACLGPLTPEFFVYDPDRQLLITKLITDGEDLWEYFRGHVKLGREVSSFLGGLLGTYHKECGASIYQSAQTSIFPRQLPWILTSERRTAHPFKQLSQATSALFDRVEASSHLRTALDQIRDDWKTTVLLHGDLKLENCIVSGTDSASDMRLTIVDWELADIGDPCWDIGSILQSFVTASVMSLPTTGNSGSLSDFLEQTSHKELLCSLRSFWQEYVLKLKVQSGPSLELLERCLKYGGARMIQSAYEYMQFSLHLSSNAIHLLTLSEDLLTNTGDVSQLLLE